MSQICISFQITSLNVKQYQSKLTRKQSKKDKKAGKLLCNWKFETRKPNYLKSCSPLYCAESDLPAIQNAQLEVSPVLIIESSNS